MFLNNNFKASKKLGFDVDRFIVKGELCEIDDEDVFDEIVGKAEESSELGVICLKREEIKCKLFVSSLLLVIARIFYFKIHENQS